MSAKKETLLLDSFLTFFFVILILFGCATAPSPKASNIQDADYRQVKNCRFVGDVYGSSGWGNLAASTGIQNAKNEAREQAAAIGATHIVWVQIVGGSSPYVVGKAYRCK